MYYYAPKLYLLRPYYLYSRFNVRRMQLPQSDLNVTEQILAAYDLDLTDTPYFMYDQGRSNTIILQTAQGKKLLKQYKPTVAESTIIHEHSVLQYLATIDFPAPRLVATKTNKTWILHNEGFYAIFDFIKGGDQYTKYILLPSQRRQSITISGKLLADLHNELQHFTPEGYNPDGFKSKTEDRWRDFAWYTQKLEFCLTETPHLFADEPDHPAHQLWQRGEEFKQSLYDLHTLLEKADLPRLVIHGDYGPYNLLFFKNTPVVVIDFELTRLDWRLTELADTVWRFGADRFVEFNLNKIKIFIDAYQSRWPLDKEELHYLPEVWKYLHTLRAIKNWYKYCTFPKKEEVHNLNRHLDMIKWMNKNQDDFLRTLKLL